MNDIAAYTLAQVRDIPAANAAGPWLQKKLRRLQPVVKLNSIRERQFSKV